MYLIVQTYPRYLDFLSRSLLQHSVWYYIGSIVRKLSSSQERILSNRPSLLCDSYVSRPVLVFRVCDLAFCFISCYCCICSILEWLSQSK
jgi:hypothetical protein